MINMKGRWLAGGGVGAGETRFILTNLVIG